MNIALATIAFIAIGAWIYTIRKSRELLEHHKHKVATLEHRIDTLRTSLSRTKKRARQDNQKLAQAKLEIRDYRKVLEGMPDGKATEA